MNPLYRMGMEEKLWKIYALTHWFTTSTKNFWDLSGATVKPTIAVWGAHVRSTICCLWQLLRIRMYYFNSTWKWWLIYVNAEDASCVIIHITIIFNFKLVILHHFTSADATFYTVSKYNHGMCFLGNKVFIAHAIFACHKFNIIQHNSEQNLIIWVG